MSKILIVKVFKSKNEKYCKFWCLFCNKFHFHSVQLLGYRTTHCTNKDSPYYKKGYIIKEYTKKELEDIKLFKN